MMGNEGDGELMRDRLVALINEAKDEYPTIPSVNCCKPTFAYYLANHLLANGVIVPPCKVGDMIYALNYDRNGYVPLKVTSRESLVRWMDEDQFGNTLFITREEAERALKGEHHAEIH